MGIRGALASGQSLAYHTYLAPVNMIPDVSFKRVAVNPLFSQPQSMLLSLVTCLIMNPL